MSNKLFSGTASGLGSLVIDLYRRMVHGVGAFIFQSYDEVNKKRGIQWEISREVVGVADGAKLYSVMIVGSKYVDLKSRTLGATGAGVYGRIYRLLPSDIASVGTPDKWYNMKFDVDVDNIQPETKVYVANGAGQQITFTGGVTAQSLATLARKRGADIYAYTSSQNQASGVLPARFGSNRILAPGSILLLEIESKDAAQDINASLEIYEGPLDFYE